MISPVGDTTAERLAPAGPRSAALPDSLPGFGPCPVTEPNPEARPAGVEDFFGPGWYGNDAMATNIRMWGEGEVAVPSTHGLPDGSYGYMKWAWYQRDGSHLRIDGRRLDGAAAPLSASLNDDGYGQGVQVTGLVFPTGSCWEVTGRAGDASLTFVTVVLPPTPIRANTP